LQAFGGDVGKQIGIDLVVFAHGDGSVPRLRSRQEP
jgi:fucose 4-O-acetylase-like acetyltransferase